MAERIVPARIPIPPPMTAIIADSARNCSVMDAVVAPIDFRIPISLVRSVTDTSIIFMTPIPPTTSEIAATSMTNIVTVPIRLFI